MAVERLACCGNPTDQVYNTLCPIWEYLHKGFSPPHPTHAGAAADRAGEGGHGAWGMGVGVGVGVGVGGGESLMGIISDIGYSFISLYT